MNQSVLVFGGDGYLGWSIALALASRTDYDVVIVDNCAKRKWQRRTRVRELFELPLTFERVANYIRITGRTNLYYENTDLGHYESVERVLKTWHNHSHPVAVINAAQQPSAPFSMMCPEYARFTFDNNSTTNLNALWALANVCKKVKYIAVGSAGAFQSIDVSFIPKQKVNLNFTYNNELHKIYKTWLPMQATDVYHQSKANTFLLTDMLTQNFGLRSATVQQSTIFGNTIHENNNDEYGKELATHFNYDHIFGTVLNRFVCQAVYGHPLTVYGDGTQQSGLISLNNAVNAYIDLIDRDIDEGEHQVEHNGTHGLSVLEIAQTVSKVSGQRYAHMPNPRIEPQLWLEKEFESNPIHGDCISNMLEFEEEILNLFNFVKQFRSNIVESYIFPTVNWSAAKSECE